MKKIALILTAIAAFICYAYKIQTVSYNISIPTVGNSWIRDSIGYISSETVSSKGICNWKNKNERIRTFFHIEKRGKISLGIKAKINSGNSKIEVRFNDKIHHLTLSGKNYTDYDLGEFLITEPGYHFLDILGLSKSQATFGDISEVLVRHDNTNSIKYIKDDFYFGRRGPSDHLNFEIPQGIENIEWFYSELLIPENQDVVGSYFMANGFNEGYFGIQVNSPSERRILFSIWSPYETDDPSKVPEEYRIKLLKKGEGVISGTFGNEGSGGQSYKRYNWKPDESYGFLVGASPDGQGNTDFIAYFFDPNQNKWQLIAQFRRPKTKAYLNGLYSFLENFIPEQGVYDRKGIYHTQWVYNDDGWHEITSAKFTADNTARKEYRLDYSGGLEGNGFYLQNCGFTNEHTTIGKIFTRAKRNQTPKIDFEKLK